MDGQAEELAKNTYESLLCTYGPLSTFLLVFMAGLIFFNLSENQFVHVAARLPSGALHHASADLVCPSKALCWMAVIGKLPHGDKWTPVMDRQQTNERRRGVRGGEKKVLKTRKMHGQTGRQTDWQTDWLPCLQSRKAAVCDQSDNVTAFVRFSLEKRTTRVSSQDWQK